MLRRPEFTDLFLVKSCARPQILFTGHKQGELFFFSTPQPHDNSALVTTSHHMKFAFDTSFVNCGSVRGLVCLTHVPILNARKEKLVPVIFNPTTGQSFPLPKIKTKRFEFNNSFFGYDPVGKQFKVLSMTCPGYGTWELRTIAEEHQILTLGAKIPSWRMLKCRIPHYPLSSGVYIDGVLYYVASARVRSSWITLIVSFDVRSEKFGFIKRDEGMFLLSDSILVKYKGKLASLLSDGLYDFMFRRVNRQTERFEMWVLEDREKHVWSKHVYELPARWEGLDFDDELDLVGVTDTNEILLSPCSLSVPFYVFYYNIERKIYQKSEDPRNGRVQQLRS